MKSNAKTAASAIAEKFTETLESEGWSVPARSNVLELRLGAAGVCVCVSGNDCRNKTSAERVEGKSTDCRVVAHQHRRRGHGNISLHDGQVRSGANPSSIHVPTRPDTGCVSKFSTHSEKPVRFFECDIDIASRTDGQLQLVL